jgi:hypothetical protein
MHQCKPSLIYQKHQQWWCISSLPMIKPKDSGAHCLHELHARHAPGEVQRVAQDNTLAHLIILLRQS